MDDRENTGKWGKIVFYRCVEQLSNCSAGTKKVAVVAGMQLLLEDQP